MGHWGIAPENYDLSYCDESDTLVTVCCRVGLRAGVRGRGEESTRARSRVLPSAAGYPRSDAAHLRPRPGGARRPPDHPQVRETVAAEVADVQRRAVACQNPSPPAPPRQPLTPSDTRHSSVAVAPPPTKSLSLHFILFYAAISYTRTSHFSNYQTNMNVYVFVLLSCYCNI